jgi:hypothetical protein
MHNTRDQLVELTANGETIAQYPVMVTGETDADGNPCAAALIFDSANRGRFTGNAVVELATEYGCWPTLPKMDTDCDDQYDPDDIQDAEDYINSLVPDGWQFGFDDGSFYLANDAWWRMVGS